MVKPPVLRVFMQARDYQNNLSARPYISARLGLGEATTKRIHALVDTGASFTVATFELAAQLGLSPGSFKRNPSMKLAGLGGKEVHAWAMRLDLHLWTANQPVLLLPHTLVWFYDGRSDDPLILGQHDVLERLTFVQRNHPPAREFVLSVPQAPKPRRRPAP